MTKKQQTRFGIISGTILLLILLGIALIVKCPSGFLVFTTRIILALAAAAYLIIIPGTLNLKNNIVSAGGAMAVFALIFFINPAPLDSFSDDCLNRIEGSITIGTNPAENVQLSFLEINKSTTTNGSGNFSTEVSELEVPESLRLKLYKTDVQLDTILTFSKSSLDKNLPIQLKEYCVFCEQKDSTQKIVNRRLKCSASYKYTQNYIDGFMQASNEQALVGTCKYD